MVCNMPRRKYEKKENNTHIRTEMDTYDKMERDYGICRLTDNTQKYSPNVETSSKKKLVMLLNFLQNSNFI